ncbi:hypothetical protein [uncultured Draconibacterium sp.]|uniref:hypothetical protein n=1 Tax=uncultured Draconibacterium sp. TaxID=1573823 RepID=UPI002AA7FDCE|nr:hypothetical protein [uncultured Draconibacterium sp.]
MWKSIRYKEWIKTRWFVMLYAFLGLSVVAYMFLIVHRNFKFTDASSYWYELIFMGASYFSILKFVPLAGGLVLSLAQYFPEIVNKRIKLSFHLPVNENRVLMMMMLYGTISLLLIYTIILGAFWGISCIYFPSDIYMRAIISVAPWFLAGFAAYYLTALIVLEPVWKYRLGYFIVAIVFNTMYFKASDAGAYAPVNIWLGFLVTISSVSLLFSGYRFRKGEM